MSSTSIIEIAETFDAAISPCPSVLYVTGQDKTDITAAARQSAVDFFLRTGISRRYHHWTYDPTGTVEKRFTETLQSWKGVNFMTDVFKQPRQTSVCVATTMFGHTHIDTQVIIALYSLLAGCVDDLEIEDRALEEFAQRLSTNTPQLHPVLDLLVHYLRLMPDYYPSYSATAIFAGTIQFVNSTLFDRRCESEIHMSLQKDALPFIRYKRARNSLGEVYNLFAWDKKNFPDITEHIQILPDARVYLDYANDILSFYKEEMAGESNNFVHDRAVVTRRNIPTVLSDMLDELVASVHRARSILQSERGRNAWEVFIEGYVVFHFLSPRYRLEELLGEDFRRFCQPKNDHASTAGQ